MPTTGEAPVEVPTIGEPSSNGRHTGDVTVIDVTASRNKPAGGWALKVEYDPEKGSRQEDFYVESSEYVKRFQVRPTIIDKEGEEHNPEFQGILMAPTRESWRPVQINSMESLHQFMQSPAGQIKQLKESGDWFDGIRPSPVSNTQLIDTEFVPIMAGPFFKQQYLYDYLAMHARAFEMVNHNALASCVVKILQRFTLGRGISFHIKNPKTRAIWQEFWERNRMRARLREIARDLTWQGEIMLRLYDKPKDGYTAVRVLDCSTCWEIVTDPEDFEHVYYYHFQWPTPYQIWVSGQIPISRYIIQQIPPTNIMHLKINASSQEKRGRSDLLPVMPWLKRFNDYYNGITVKAMLEANLVWKIKVKGDQSDVDAFLNNPALTQLPPPGGHWIENDAVELTPITAQMTAGGRGSQGIGGQIASIVAASMNLPPEYLNIETGGGGSARATALVRTDPAVKTIEDRQQLLRELLEELYDRVITSAILAGRLDPMAAREEPETGDGNADDSMFDPDSDLPTDAAPVVAPARTVSAPSPRRRIVLR